MRGAEAPVPFSRLVGQTTMRWPGTLEVEVA